MYVRKYDPPMLVGTAEYNSVESEIAEALKKNIGMPTETTNDMIINHVRENIEEMGGFVDTLTFFEKG